MTSHLQAESIEAKSAPHEDLRVKLTEKKMRFDKTNAPITAVYEEKTGLWSTLGKIDKPTELNERQSWLAAEAYRILDTKNFRVLERTDPVAYVCDLRDTHKKNGYT